MTDGPLASKERALILAETRAVLQTNRTPLWKERYARDRLAEQLATLLDLAERQPSHEPAPEPDVPETLRLVLASASAALLTLPNWTPQYAIDRLSKELRDLIYVARASQPPGEYLRARIQARIDHWDDQLAPGKDCDLPFAIEVIKELHGLLQPTATKGEG